MTASSLGKVPVPGPPTSDTEIEWQLDALDLRAVERWLGGSHSPPPSLSDPNGDGRATDLVVEPRTPTQLVDAYLDTSDWRMHRAGFVLRIRRKGSAAEVTVKDAGERRDGLRQRLEVSEPLPPEGLAALGQDGPVGRRLAALVGTRPLGKVLEVRTHRHPFALRLGGSETAELSLDDTVIEGAPGTPLVRLRRVEIEVVGPDAVERVEPFVTRLRSECGLRPAALSKFEAGIMAAGIEIPPAPDVGPTELSPSPSVAEVALVVLRRNLLAMLAHEAGTRLGDDPEDLHDMRVATRRMRAALALFADALPARARHLRDELGWLAQALGAVRDLDVQLQRVAQWTEEVSEEDRAALGDLLRMLDHQRQDARRRLLAALETKRYERLVSDFTNLLRQGPPPRSAPANAPALVVVPELLRARHRAVAKAAKQAGRTGAAEDFHRLRIRGKRLRYALEFVNELYGSPTRKYVSQLVRMQDTLGLMQDARVAADRLHALVTERGGALSHLTVFVMGGVAERYRQEAARLARDVPARMKKVTGRRWHRLAAHLDRRRAEAARSWASGSRGPSAVPAPPAAIATTEVPEQASNGHHSTEPVTQPGDG
jgi:CHAD domain-containing protein